MRRGKRLRLWTLTALLWLSLTSSACFGTEAPEITITRVPPGWEATEAGYFANAAAMTEIAVALSTYRQELDLWTAAYYDMKERADRRSGELASQMAALKTALDGERDAWRASVRKARAPGLGVFAGVGYSAGGEIQAVAGVGIVLKIF